MCSEELLVRSHLESANRAMVTKPVSATVDSFRSFGSLGTQPAWYWLRQTGFPTRHGSETK